MRVVGIVLVVLGALGLAYQGFTYVTKEKVADAGSVEVSREKVNTVWIPPAASGIALVSGLILLAAGGRKDG
jgi:hypothetical protein